VSAAELATAWTFEPLIVLTVGSVVIAYTRGLTTMRPLKDHVIGIWRPVAFYTGIAAVVAALISPIDALSDRLFLFHMIQHLLLVFVAAPLILIGAPVLPMMRGIPDRVRRVTVIPGARSSVVRSLARFPTHPMLAWTAFVISLWAWHMPPLYTAAIESELAHIVEHGTFVMTALLFWWLVIEPVPFRGRIPYLARFAYVILALTQSLPLAAMLTFTSEPWYEPYIASGGLWGIDPLTDQQIGGLIMWVGGMVSYFIAVAALFVVVMKKDEEDTIKRQIARGTVRLATTPRASNG
jgi:putative membrane protein